MSVSGFPTTLDACRRILSYSRTSADRLLSAFGQDEEIREWAEREGMEVVGYGRDVEVHSQSPVDERRALPEIVKAIEDGKADGIAVSRLDRLARDFLTQDDAMKRIWRAGGRVFSADYGEWKPDRPGDPQWRLRRDYARMAEDELHALLARLQNGRRRKMAHGGYGGGDRLGRRYGVELVEIQGRLDYRPVPAEQEIIRRICAACEGGKGYQAMADALNAEGVPTVKGKPWRRWVVRELALRGPDHLVEASDPQRSFEPLEWLIAKEGTA